MAEFNVKIIGMKELESAIKRSPQNVLNESKLFLQRGMALYKHGIQNNPWRMGMSGGGSPVKTRHLIDSHRTEYQGLKAMIYPTAKYASYVHGITGFPRKRSYQLRPWMTYVYKNQEIGIEQLYRKLLSNLTADMAR